MSDNLPVPADQTTNLPARPAASRLSVAYGTPLSACPTNLDPKSPHHAAIASSALCEADAEISGTDWQEMPVWAYLCHPASRVDEETGVVREFTRLVLIGPDGETLATTSDVMLHRFAAILDLVASSLGKGPWDPPLSVQVRARRRKKGPGVYHECRLAPAPTSS